MNSVISWLDADEAASEQARRLIAATTDADGGTLDQLGLGAIRDFCSDHLFPGTSTLWRRARYLLFVPWCYQGRDPAGTQRKLRRSLVARHDGLELSRDHGIIGAQKDVDRLPDEVVWNGLVIWGIRLAEITRPAAAAAWSPVHASPDEGAAPIWHPRLPPRPDDFPKRQQIRLEVSEANFLAGLLTDLVVHPRDRHAARRQASRLPFMLTENLDADVWDWRTVPRSAAPELRELLRDAACLADLAWSARALYALMVAERAGIDPGPHRERLGLARRRIRSASVSQALAGWDLDRFRARVLRERPNAVRAFAFLAQWRALTQRTFGPLDESDEARGLITDREARVKPGRARLTGERPEPVALPWPYDFRAEVARNILVDIQAARS